MFLARTVLHSSVTETKRRIHSLEFESWKIEYRRMPWGDDWLQAGTIAAAAIAPYCKKSPDPMDFIPGMKPKEQTEDQMLNVFKMFAAQQEAVTKAKPGEIVRKEKL